jgi:DNA-binding NarL/FixJ family response regulator
VLQVIFIGKINQTNDIVSEILRSSLDASVDFISPETDYADLLPLLSGNLSIIIYDLNTSHGCGNAPDNIKDIKTNSPDIPILVLDHHADKKFVQPLIDAGASGIISHTPTEPKLVEAVNELLNGNTFYKYPD